MATGDVYMYSLTDNTLAGTLTVSKSLLGRYVTADDIAGLESFNFDSSEDESQDFDALTNELDSSYPLFNKQVVDYGEIYGDLFKEAKNDEDDNDPTKDRKKDGKKGKSDDNNNNNEESIDGVG